ncbi:WYL domain-containing protein [Paenibacillus sp. TRM 82003]|nr:WYL domain-containing protein [Paenibacillus sp. TRM 82003]
MAILFALQGGASVTARELAERLEVSTRTVTRDLEALGASGVPVYAERGYGGGWRLADGFRARFNGLKRDDLERLLLSQTGAAKLFADLGREREYRETWEKLLKTASSEHPASAGEAKAVQDRIHIDGAGWRESFEAFPFLPTLYDAVWAGRMVAMRYGTAERLDETNQRGGAGTRAVASANAELEAAAGGGASTNGAPTNATSTDAASGSDPAGEPSPERALGPLGLVAKGGVWYVVGLSGGEIRTFRVSRIRTVRDTGEPFERPSDFDLAAYWNESMRTFRERLPSYVAELRLSSEALEQLRGRRYVKTRVLETAADGRLRIESDFETEAYAAEQLLALASRGFRAEVLAPASLQAAVHAAATLLLDGVTHNQAASRSSSIQ